MKIAVIVLAVIFIVRLVVVWSLRRAGRILELSGLRKATWARRERRRILSECRAWREGKIS